MQVYGNALFLLDLDASLCLRAGLPGTLLPDKTVLIVTGDYLTRLDACAFSG